MSVEYDQGADAFRRGMPASCCPYSYKNSGYPEQELFDKHVRPQLDQWMRGYIDARKSAENNSPASAGGKHEI